MTRIPSGVTDQYIYFVAVDSADLKTRETGLSSFTVYRSRNGGAAAAMTTPTINETDATNMPGVYELLLDEDMTIDSGDDTQEMCFHIAHAGMAPVTRVIELYRPPVTSGQTLNVSAGVGEASVQSIANDAITAASIQADAIGAAELATDAVQEIRNAITGGAYSLDTDANGRIRLVIGTGSGELSLTSGLIDGIAGTLNTLDELDTAQDTQHATTQDKLLGYAQLLARSDAGIATDRSTELAEINANEGSGAGDYSNQTDALEAIKDAGVSIDLATMFTSDTGETYSSAVAGSVVKEIADNAGGSSLTVADIADGVWDELQSGHVGAGTFGEIATEIASILADTNELQADWADGGRLDLIVDAILVDTGTTLDGKIDTIDTNVDAILVDTGTTLDGKIDTIDSIVDAIVADTNELQTDWADGGRLDVILDARAAEATVAALNDLSAAEVNAEVVDALQTDTPVDGKSITDSLQIIAAVVAGKISGAGTGTETFVGLDAATSRAVVTVDASGNRSAVSYP